MYLVIKEERVTLAGWGKRKERGKDNNIDNSNSSTIFKKGRDDICIHRFREFKQQISVSGEREGREA